MFERVVSAVALSAGLIIGVGARADARDAAARIDEALQNITTIIRPDKVGYATFWDGNKYIQCRRMPTRELRCEAAGTAMQPSLKIVLSPERISHLSSNGWILDSSFGNFVQTFPADWASERAAQHILRTLIDVYDAKPANLEYQTAWVADLHCPPRNGPSQNLAGMVNDAAAMRARTVYCSYNSASEMPRIANSAAELIDIYGSTVSAEIQRLRINANRRVQTIFGAGIGYIQCMPERPTSAIYCEAQSKESWAALGAVLTPERISRLHQAGYADPGRTPNYSRNYPAEKYSDTAIAGEILTILHDVYGYKGATKLNIKTE